MREYIHFFEDSDLRDTYEHGSDYTEPYVSYTPVINKYEVQHNGINDDNLIIKKQRGEYLISSSNEQITVISLTTGTIPKISNDLFYAIYVRKKAQSGFFVIEEDLELTDQSTEVTVHRGEGEGTLYIVNSDENIWEAYEDSEHTSRIGTLIKFDIVSTPSSSNTDSVHYNKKYPVIYINTYKSTTACGGAFTGKGYNIRYLTLIGGIPYEEIFEYLQDDETLIIIEFYDADLNGKYRAIYKCPINKFTTLYPSSTDNTSSYRTVIPQEDYVNFDPDWKFGLIYPSSCIFDDVEGESPGIIVPGEPVEDPGMILS